MILRIFLQKSIECLRKCLRAWVLLGTILIILQQNAWAQTTPSKIVILVPGFFNSFAPEYFSQDIVRSFEAKKLKVIVAKGLNPIGTIQDNGERVFQLFQSVRLQNPTSEINVVGHSAGGLYALYAINKGAYFIKTILSVSTPFDGIEFVENWDSRSHLFSELMKLCWLEGLRTLTKPTVNRFIASVKVPSSLKILAFAGYQPVKLNIFDAANMSAVLSVTDAFMNGPSDGIVSFKSATSTTNINTLQKSILTVKPELQNYIPLEHWEQVLDYRHFVLLGTPNIKLIRQRQIQFYSNIANLL